MRDKTFHVTYSDDQPTHFDYVFSWDDGHTEHFVVMALHGAILFASHFHSLGYLDLAKVAADHHDYVHLNYKHLTTGKTK